MSRRGLLVLLTLLHACASSVAPSSVGLYNEATAGPQDVRGSNVQVSGVRTVNYNASDAAEAISRAFNMMGLDFDAKDSKKGLHTGSGNWNAPGQVTTCATPYTFAAYVRQIDSKPTTRVTVLIDRHSFCGSALFPERVLMSQVMANFAKVLMTF